MRGEDGKLRGKVVEASVFGGFGEVTVASGVATTGRVGWGVSKDGWPSLSARKGTLKSTSS